MASQTCSSSSYSCGLSGAAIAQLGPAKIGRRRITRFCSLRVPNIDSYHMLLHSRIAPILLMHASPRSIRMDSSWRPETVDPLGQAFDRTFGAPKERERASLLRAAEQQQEA